MIREVYDYVVIGSGPGGAPLAVRLAEAGHRVLVLEAGGLSSRGDGQPDLVHDVPAYHSAASEDPGMRWDYFVKNYSDRRLRRANSKDHQGRTYYPRSATLGGCSAHNALISIYPFDRDWDAIAELTGNTQWSASNLRRIFEEKLVASSGSQGWLPIQRPDLKLLKEDPVLAAITVNAAVETFLTDLAQSADTDRLSDLSELVLNNLSADLLGNLPEFVGGTKKDLLKQQLLSHFDPNARGALAAGREGLFTLPLCTQNGVRYSTRTLLQAARQRLPNLVIHPGSLAQRIVLADDKPRRAIAVEYLQAGQDQGVIAGDRTGRPVGQGAKRRIAFAKFEIVVAAGAFESPHLLMLSGIGPREQLERCEIDPLVDLPGVGENLQDRAEVAVVSRLKQPLTTLQGATLLPESAASDPAFAKWQASQKQGGPDHGHAAGIYATNGGTVARALRSAAARKHGEHDPDLILFGLAADFRGYELDYSRKLVTDPAEHRTLTWAILKARTANRGTVQLDRNHPEGPPEINFRYFNNGEPHTDAGAQRDLEALTEGVQTARKMMQHPVLQEFVAEEVWPGPACQTDQQVQAWIQREVWGHHACGTCKIGTKADELAVLNSRFQVRGVQNLRVVDAAVFPNIPGFFIGVPTYLVSELAAEMMLSQKQS